MMLAMADGYNKSMDTDTKARFRRLAAARGRPTRELLREAVRRYLDEEESEEEENRLADEAYAEYLATGRHVAHEDVMAWLQARARGESPPLPRVRTREE